MYSLGKYVKPKPSYLNSQQGRQQEYDSRIPLPSQRRVPKKQENDIVRKWNTVAGV